MEFMCHCKPSFDFKHFISSEETKIKIFAHGFLLRHSVSAETEAILYR